VAFSCKRRGVCPSCGAKRAAELAAFLQDEVVEQVGHAQWVFTIPKMLRIYFRHHRELLGALSLAASAGATRSLARLRSPRSLSPTPLVRPCRAGLEKEVPIPLTYI